MIRIGIVDDHQIVRTGLRQFLSESVDFRVTGEAASAGEALALVRVGDVDVLLLDLSMPGEGGVDILAQIKAIRADLPVLILSGYPETHYATAMIRRGASGYLGKDCDAEEIATAIRTVARGRRYITPTVAELLAEGMAGDANRASHETLSERELQVFLRLAQGETVGHIARSTALSVKTISTYRSRVLEKLKLQSNSDLTYYALKNGLIR